MRLLVALLAALGLFVAPVFGQGEEARGSQGAAENSGRLVRDIRVEGNRRYRSSQLISAFGIRQGDPVRPEDVTRGIGILWDTFRVRADVYFRPFEGGTADEVELLLVVDELPTDLEPRFIGNVEIKDEELREWAGIGLDAELFLYRAPRIRERLLRAYEQEGYHFARIRVVERSGGVDPETGEVTVPDVIFEISEGPKVRVRNIVLNGNEFLPDSGFWFFRRGLRKLAGMEMRGPRLFRLFSKAFVQESLDADIVALRDVYRDYGFLDVVVELEKLEFSDDGSWVTIHIAIDEGEPYTVRSVKVHAISLTPDPTSSSGWQEVAVEPVLDSDELEFELKAGERFEQRFIDADERLLREAYGKLGYLDHPTIPQDERWDFLTPELTFSADENAVDVTYILLQGKQQFIREVLIRGNLHTQDRVIRRMITVKPGDIADPTEIASSRNRIQGSGLFSNPRNILEHREPTFRFVETEDPNWKDLEYVVEQGQVLTFQLSGGVSTNTGAFGIVSVEHRNFDVTDLPSSPWSAIREIAEHEAFHGAGQELRLRAAPGTEVSFFNVLFREPDLFGSHENRISLTLRALKRFQRFDSHDEERNEFGFDLGRQVGLDSFLFAGYTVGSVELDDLDTQGEPQLNQPLSVPALLKAQEGKSDLGHVSVSYRLRTTDDRLFPRNGLAFSTSLKYYAEEIGSDFDFMKAEAGWDWYFELDPEGPQVSDRVHVELRGGVAFGIGDTEDVPYSERYFLGGQSSLRGFDYRGVGPNQNGFAIGGETMLYGTLEYRRPLVTTTQPGTYRELETVHWGFFLDAGILDPEDFSLETDELRASAGILFGLSVPLPITFSFGWPLEEGPGDDTQVIGFRIGE